MWKFTIILESSIRKSTRTPSEQASELQTQWQSCEVIAAVFSAFSLCFATVDYELRFADDRTNDNCSTNDNVTDAYRWLILVTTLLAAFFVVSRYMRKRAWLILKTSNQAKARQVFRRFRKWKLLATMTCGELAMLCVFPYPGLHEVPLTMKEKQLLSADSHGIFGNGDYCLLLSELLYALMFVRVYFLLRAFLNYSIFADRTARRICAQFDEVPNLKFNVRALARKYPHLSLIATVGLLCFEFSFLVRVFERPYREVSLLDFNPMINALWFTISTLYIAPFGDFFTMTYPGRAVSYALAILSLSIATVAYMLMSDFIDFSRKEMNTFENIKATRYAARVIESWYIYCKRRKEVSAQEWRTLKENFVRAADRFGYELPRLSHMVGLSERIRKKKFQKLLDIDYHFFRIDNKLGMGLKKLERDVAHMHLLMKRLDVLLYPARAIAQPLQSSRS